MEGKPKWKGETKVLKEKSYSQNKILNFFFFLVNTKDAYIKFAEISEKL
jgi:hypothetical protein